MLARIVEIVDGPIDAARLLAAIGHPSAGGTALFIGATRTPSDGREVSYLEYEAYRPMALKMMEEIVGEAGRRWALVAACAAHRVGRVDPGEASVLVAASAEHRAAAFEACRFLIDEIKREVPIWKKEVYADGDRRAGP
jgi:molybdopterin synthase catalytic subunit